MVIIFRLFPYKEWNKTREIIAINLIRIFNAGPEVSLNGSPTVSPTTAALCVSEPLPPNCPVSIYF